MITNIITYPDLRDSTSYDLKARDYINSIPNTDVQAVLYIGDYSGVDCSIFNITGKQQYFVEGNHSGCGKGQPNLYVSNLLNTGVQLYLAPFNWPSGNWNQIDQTKPSIIATHVNFIGRGCAHSVDKSLRAKVDSIKNCYVGICGHDHGFALEPITNRIYYIDSTPPPIQACGAEPFLIGWLQIDESVQNRITFRYARVDPQKTYSGIPTTWLKEVNTDITGPLSASLSVNPQTIFQNQQVTYTTTATGGAPPYSYAYNNLPEPCQTQSQSSITCAPTNPGTYISTVNVKDSANTSVTSTTTLVVNPSTPQTELQHIIENVQSSIKYRYQTRDDKNNVTDTIKIIENPAPSQDAKYLGVYHTLISGTFRVKLATSIDLLNWIYKVDLDSNASQPYIISLPDGGFVVAMEASQPSIHLKFKHYNSLNSLFSNNSDKIFDAPRTMQNGSVAEGTPNIYSVILDPDINNSVIDVGFHYFEDSTVDRQARGTLTNFSDWTTKIETQVNTAIINLGVKGNIGDRDNIIFNGKSYNIIEGQLVKGDWSSWRCFLYDWSNNTAIQLNIKTHKGSKSFANPSFTKTRDPSGNPALVVTLFLPSEGAATGEAGQLIYYNRISEVTKYRCKGAPDFICIEDPNGPFSSLQECQANCKPVKWRCSGAPDFQCVVDPSGPFNTLEECQANCKPTPEKKFNVYTIGDSANPSGVLAVKSIPGNYTADDACTKVCNELKNIN